jgi:nitrogenase-associated protein
MAIVVFYEKPGCTDHLKQKELLRQAGHLVEERNIMQHPWTDEELRSFFSGLDVVHWFNRLAPRIKSGEFNPNRVDDQTAIRLMLVDPDLIRRPLMQVGDERRAGFDPIDVDGWLGLGPGKGR